MMVNTMVNRRIKNEYRWSDLKLNLSFAHNTNEMTGKMKPTPNKGSHNISNIAPTRAN
jgi:hypothetical protein